jgi:chaperonin cofactor prefoldin
MKGIYLTEEGKKEIENRLTELDKLMKLIQKAANDDKDFDMMKNIGYAFFDKENQILKEILSSATILPVETNMSYVKSQDFGDEFTIEYPNGVIIQPKQ